MLALGACATLGAARADVITLWATSVPETSSPASTTPWNNEGYAASAPTCNNCNTTTSCQYATNAVNSNTTPLSAVAFGNFVLPANHRIVRVQADVQCRHNENTTATVGFRAYAPAHGIDSGWRTSPAFNSIAVGGVYICADRLAGTGDITGITTNWTAAKVNDLQLQVRRQAGLTNNTLRVLAMKLVVTTEPNPAAPTVPNTPTNLRTTAATTNSIALAWNDNASNETGYVLYQLAPGLDPAVISNWITANLPVNATSTTRTGLTAGSTYRFHVRAINAAGLGAQSNTLAATTVAPPAGSQFFINELRMTGGGDSYVEVVAPAGTVLDGNYKILKLNGGPNAQYAGTLENSRTFVGNPPVANMGGGMGVARVGYLGLQAGERAGYAFVRYQGTQVQVLDFVTYRGGSANAGPVTSKVPGMVGAVGPVLPYSLLGAPNTLRLVGSGCHRGYFQWALPASNGTEGAVNIGQTFTNCP